MKLKVEHLTQFEYDSPVFETTTEVRLQPAGGPGCPQQLKSFNLMVEPVTRVFNYPDFYDNQVHYFTLLPPHESLLIRTSAVVKTGPGNFPADPKDRINIYDYQTACRYIVFSEAAQAYAAALVPEQTGLPSMALAEQVCRAINAEFQYRKGVTNVYSTVEQVLQQKSGVCQDFAHVMITICRILGLPTRYVSGYLYGGEDGQEGASHAWCEVLDTESQEWRGFDPTHSRLKVDERYIKIGHGRDYGDIPPVKGTYKGRATESLQVKVYVTAPKEDKEDKV
jgi:transglutaminase-like putative cysteine protease